MGDKKKKSEKSGDVYFENKRKAYIQLDDAYRKELGPRGVKSTDNPIKGGPVSSNDIGKSIASKGHLLHPRVGGPDADRAKRDAKTYDDYFEASGEGRPIESGTYKGINEGSVRKNISKKDADEKKGKQGNQKTYTKNSRAGQYAEAEKKKYQPKVK